MSKLLKNGFQSVSETEMLMVEGGVGSYSSLHSDFEGAGWYQEKTTSNIVNEESNDAAVAVAKSLSIMKKSDKLLGGGGFGIPCAISTLNDFY